MADGKQRSRRAATRPRPARSRATQPAAAETATQAVTRAAAAAAPVGATPQDGGLPIGLDSATLAADVSGQLRAVAPTFGEVLKSIGSGVAASQQALDQGVIDTVKELATTNISVVTDVIQHLNDDGEPDPAQTELVSTDLSVLNFFMPTIHEWKRVAVAMDLSIGAFNEKDGLTFKARQTADGTSTFGAFWGFLGVGEQHFFNNTQSSERTHEQESSWSQGEVRLDATLGPRTTQSFPTPTQVALGPQITFSEGTVTETPVAGAGVNRAIDVQVKVLTHAGAANPGKAVTVEAGTLRIAFSSTAPFTGSTTNAQGDVLVTLTRNVPNAGTGPARVPVSVRLGALTQTFTLTI
jgi:hypothetical protein